MDVVELAKATEAKLGSNSVKEDGNSVETPASKMWVNFENEYQIRDAFFFDKKDDA